MGVLLFVLFLLFIGFLFGYLNFHIIQYKWMQHQLDREVLNRKTEDIRKKIQELKHKEKVTGP